MYWGVALIVALVVASWLSVAKPWGRIRPVQRARREPDAHPAVWVAALLVPFVDYLLDLQGGVDAGHRARLRRLPAVAAGTSSAADGAACCARSHDHPTTGHRDPYLRVGWVDPT